MTDEKAKVSEDIDRMIANRKAADAWHSVMETDEYDPMIASEVWNRLLLEVRKATPQFREHEVVGEAAERFFDAYNERMEEDELAAADEEIDRKRKDKVVILDSLDAFDDAPAYPGDRELARAAAQRPHAADVVLRVDVDIGGSVGPGGVAARQAIRRQGPAHEEPPVAVLQETPDPPLQRRHERGRATNAYSMTSPAAVDAQQSRRDQSERGKRENTITSSAAGPHNQNDPKPATWEKRPRILFVSQRSDRVSQVQVIVFIFRQTCTTAHIYHRAKTVSE